MTRSDLHIYVTDGHFAAKIRNSPIFSPTVQSSLMTIYKRFKVACYKSLLEQPKQTIRPGMFVFFNIYYVVMSLKY